MSTAANHRKRSHRSQRRAGYAANSRKRLAVSGQTGGRGFRMFSLFGGLFRGRKRENGRPEKRIATAASGLAMTERGEEE